MDLVFAPSQIETWPIDRLTEASILPVNKRPRLAIRLHTSN